MLCKDVGLNEKKNLGVYTHNGMETIQFSPYVTDPVGS